MIAMKTASPENPVTIAHVAKDAGCSVSTASFVINGRAKAMRISEKTIKRVKESALRLNYVPNETARSLRRQRTGFIGVLVAQLTHEWSGQVLSGLRDVLYGEEGYLPLLTTHNGDPELEHSEIQLLLERQVEAIICGPLQDSDAYDMVIQRNVPLVFIGDTLDSMPDANYVVWDSESAARKALDHLVQTGKRSIAFIGEANPRPFMKKRETVYRDMLKGHGLSINEDWVVHLSRNESARDFVLNAFTGDSAPRPDAVFCGFWPWAVETQELLDEIGLTIPDEVAIIGMGDHTVCRHRRIAMSTMIEPAEVMGREAARVALELIRDPASGPLHRKVEGCELASRSTT